MSLYSPDEGAIPRGTAFISLLSRRDLSLQIPINYVTVPGVSLTAACFPHQRYESTAAAKCFSNLLATGFRRIEADVYWDASRRLWSLCPVQLANTNSLFNTTTIPDTPSISTSSATLASAQLTGQGAVGARQATSTLTNGHGTEETQASDTSSNVSSGLSGSTSVSGGLPAVTTTVSLSAGESGTSVVATTSASSVSTLGSSQNTLIEVGPYSCTASANFELLTTVLSEYLQNTETDLNATTRYLILNVHAAAQASDPTGSPQQPPMDALPRPGSLLSSTITSNNSVYLYTPTELAGERADLDGTGNWFASRSDYQPVAAYFTIADSNGEGSTPNGWPSEGYIELQKGKRLLAGYGRIDPQMMAYNFSGDAPYIFPPGELQATPDVANRAGVVTSGCFFQPKEYSVSVDNSSWSVFSMDKTAQSDAFALASNLISCGISSLLNETLKDTDAGEDYTLYQAFAFATNWAWAEGEPRNGSSTAGDTDLQYSCAALNATTGRWQASDCSQSHYAACRVGRTPYQWQIANQKGLYTKVNAGCPDNTTFAVPGTALENSYLVAAWRSHLSTNPDSDDPMLWLNFNDLSTNACWVVGQNATCPYLPSMDHVHGREIVVPTVAAIIVFVLAALTVFVKCAANRQSSRSRRRRGDDGWDYEGVPS